jgi:hypothetical protein
MNRARQNNGPTSCHNARTTPKNPSRPDIPLESVEIQAQTVQPVQSFVIRVEREPADDVVQPHVT